MGKLNEAKVGNFPDVDIFVLIGCPYSVLMDSSKFPKDVITSFELEMALRPGRQWTGEYTTDFADVLGPAATPSDSRTASGQREESWGYLAEPTATERAMALDAAAEEDAQAGMRYSLVTGRLTAVATAITTADASAATELSVRSAETALAVGVRVLV